MITLSGESEKTVKRLLSRVIGKKGKAKNIIERLSGATICIYGKTVSVIGTPQSSAVASSAVEDLLEGRTHGYVYSKLEKRKRLGL